MRNFLKNSKGFSLVQVMVAASLMSGLAVMLLNLQQNQQRVQVTAETDTEILQATTQIQTILYNQKSCIATITQNGVSATALPDPKLKSAITAADYRPINAIFNIAEHVQPVNPTAVPWTFPAGAYQPTLYRRENWNPPAGGINYVLPGKLAISFMGLAMVQDVAGGEEYGEIRIDFHKISNLSYGSKNAANQIIKTKFIKVQMALRDAQGLVTGTKNRNFVTCFSNINNAINSAVENSCRGNGAFLREDPATGDVTCFHEVKVPTCAPGEFLQQVRTGLSGADTTVPSGTNPNGLEFVCSQVRAVCPTPPAGFRTIVTGLPGGTPAAGNTMGVTCQNVEICSGAHDVLTYNGSEFRCLQRTCPPNQMGVMHNNQMRCLSCPVGSLIVMTPTGPECRDATCGNSGIAGTSSAPEAGAQQYFVGFDSSGNKICRDLLKGNPNACRYGSQLILNGGDGSIEQKCCPDCDAGEKANYCSGNIFYSSNGCSVCQGTKALDQGCPTPGTQCANGCMLTGACNTFNYASVIKSTCGTECAGLVPKDEGKLTAWSGWSGCSFAWQTTESRTRTCDGARCGGNCAGAETTETRDCVLNNGRPRQDCYNAGGSVFKTPQNEYICQMWSTSCPTGWGQFKNYTATSNVCRGVGSEGNGYCGDGGAGHCPFTFARDGTTVCSGSHNFSDNSTIEYNQMNRRRRGSSPGCGCHDDIGVTSVTAQRYQVGCI